jgi:hypothetical protein
MTKLTQFNVGHNIFCIYIQLELALNDPCIVDSCCSARWERVYWKWWSHLVLIT